MTCNWHVEFEEVAWREIPSSVAQGLGKEFRGKKIECCGMLQEMSL